jgi:hypothetical protein
MRFLANENLANPRLRDGQSAPCSGRVDLLGQPGFDQRLIGHITLISGSLDALEQDIDALEQDIGRRREMEVVDGFRLGKRARVTLLQFT